MRVSACTVYNYGRRVKIKGAERGAEFVKISG